jgi:hypothetical protein
VQTPLTLNHAAYEEACIGFAVTARYEDFVPHISFPLDSVGKSILTDIDTTWFPKNSFPVTGTPNTHTFKCVRRINPVFVDKLFRVTKRELVIERIGFLDLLDKPRLMQIYKQSRLFGMGGENIPQQPCQFPAIGYSIGIISQKPRKLFFKQQRVLLTD